MRTFQAHTGPALAVAYLPGGRLVSGGWDQTVAVWDVASWKERAHYDWGISSIRAVALAPDGMTAVAAGFDGTLLLWDLDGL